MAVNNYAIAKRNADETSGAVQYRIAEGSGEALMLLGRYEDANEQLQGVIDLVEDAEEKARIEALQGEIAFKQGLMDKSIAIYENGLRRLGGWVPRSLPGFGYGVDPRVVCPVPAHPAAIPPAQYGPQQRTRSCCPFLFAP